jgi:hypothetical protein
MQLALLLNGYGPHKVTSRAPKCEIMLTDRPTVAKLVNQVGLYKLNPVMTHSLKGAWFQPLSL